jgi:hypothetical protein
VKPLSWKYLMMNLKSTTLMKFPNSWIVGKMGFDENNSRNLVFDSAFEVKMVKAKNDT